MRKGGYMMNNMRITNHPVLGPEEERTQVTIFYEGQAIPAYEGEPIAAALMAAGIRVFRTTEKAKKNRGIFCGNGRCSDCMMIVDGQPNVRTCVTKVHDGMQLQVQHGLA